MSHRADTCDCDVLARVPGTHVYGCEHYRPATTHTERRRRRTRPEPVLQPEPPRPGCFCEFCERTRQVDAEDPRGRLQAVLFQIGTMSGIDDLNDWEVERLKALVAEADGLKARLAATRS
jgi:hypothetical protein